MSTRKAEILSTYRHLLEKVIPSKLPALFKDIPTKKLVVEGVPKDYADGGPSAYYMPPSADGKTPGTFFLDTSNPKQLGKYNAMTLSLHEGLPGHHFQFSYVMEQKDLPDFRKYGSENSAYTEGWGLYSEYLGYELGLYEDAYQRIGHLNYEMFRACRLVVDTGIHVMGWSRQKAIDYLREHVAMSQEDAEREIDRYISWPAQACSYKYGEIKIKQLRKEAEQILGSDFDIKDFHEVILRNAAPLSILEMQVDSYIRQTRNKALS